MIHCNICDKDVDLEKDPDHIQECSIAHAEWVRGIDD